MSRSSFTVFARNGDNNGYSDNRLSGYPVFSHLLCERLRDPTNLSVSEPAEYCFSVVHLSMVSGIVLAVCASPSE